MLQEDDVKRVAAVIWTSMRMKKVAGTYLILVFCGERIFKRAVQSRDILDPCRQSFNGLRYPGATAIGGMR